MKALKRLCAIWVCLSLVLFGSVAMASHASVKKSISTIQMELQTLGYYTGKITGRMDKKTVEAVKAFQKKHGLKVDGIPGKHTKKALDEAIKAVKAKKDKASSDQSSSN